jgi:hypothetical protein
MRSAGMRGYSLRPSRRHVVMVKCDDPAKRGRWKHCDPSSRLRGDPRSGALGDCFRTAEDSVTGGLNLDGSDQCPSVHLHLGQSYTFWTSAACALNGPRAGLTAKRSEDHSAKRSEDESFTERGTFFGPCARTASESTVRLNPIYLIRLRRCEGGSDQCVNVRYGLRQGFLSVATMRTPTFLMSAT